MKRGSRLCPLLTFPSTKPPPPTPGLRPRLAVLKQLEDLAAWAEQNPPETGNARITGLGGEGGGNIGMPITVTYGGVRTVGTATKDAATGSITFTPAA